MINYIFTNNLHIKFNKPYLYVQENSQRSLAQNIDYYSKTAQRLKKTLKIYLAQNEMLQIGYGRQEFLSNDIFMRSHLIAQSDQTFYRIVSGSQSNFPLPEVIIYDTQDGGDFTKTLDLTDIWQQAKQVCPEDNIVLRILQIQQDLIINAEINYYPIGAKCVQLESTWSVASVRLKDACVSNWYQQLDIILNKKSLTITASEEGDWHFEIYPLIFNQDKDIIVLTKENLVDEREVLVLKLIDSNQYRFFCHNKSDLIFMNDLNNVTQLLDPTLIIYSRFYQDERMRANTLSSKLSFLDQQIILETQKEQIDQAYNHCINFSNISLTQLGEHKLASREENNHVKHKLERFVRAKRQIDTQKLAKFVSMPLFHRKGLSASDSLIHPANRQDKIEKTTSKKFSVSVKVSKKPPIAYLHRYTKRKSYQLKKTNRLHYVPANSMEVLNLSAQAMDFNPITNYKSIDYFKPLNQQAIQPALFFNDSLTSLPNLLLYSVLFGKKRFLSNSAKAYRLFTNRQAEKIDEIEREVKKALYSPPFFINL